MNEHARRPPFSVAIVGAGIGGLTAAAALRRLGLEVQVYEQAHQFQRVGAGIHVAPNAVNVLLQIGLSDRDRAQAYLPDSTTSREWNSGDISYRHTLGEDAANKYGAPYELWHRGDLHAALTRLVPSSIVQMGKRLVNLDVGPSGITLAFADGSTARADVVVGADGTHSAVRTMLFGADEPRFTQRVAYRSVLPRSSIDEANLDPSCKWWGPDRHFVHYHVSGGRELAFTTSIPEEDWTAESWSAEGNVDVLKEALEGFHPQVQSVLAAVDTIYKWAIYVRDPLPQWSEGSVALLGDACHPMTPYMGQGAAMSMEDAVVLARCLRAFVDEQCSMAEATRLYEDARKDRASWIQAMSAANVWGRRSRDADPVYGYNAWTVPLPIGGDSVKVQPTAP